MTIFFPPQQRIIDLEEARLKILGPGSIPVEIPMAGNQATIYRASKVPKTLFKIYKDHMVYSEMESKLILLQQICSGITNVCPIISPVFDKAGGICVGFAMPEIVDGVSLKEMKFRTLKERLKAAGELASACFALQLRGAGPADLHDQNILIDKKGNLRIIDTDSFFFLDRLYEGCRVEHHPQLGTQEFSAFELLGNNAEVRHSHESAGYALAVVLYIILKEFHPAQLSNKVGKVLRPSDLMMKGFYGRFSRNRQGMENIDEGVPWADIPGHVRHLFERAFGPGLEHPEQRPLPQEWHEAISDWANGRLSSSSGIKKRHLLASFLFGGLVSRVLPHAFSLPLSIAVPNNSEVKPKPPALPVAPDEEIRRRNDEATKWINELKRKGKM